MLWRLLSHNQSLDETTFKISVYGMVGFPLSEDVNACSYPVLVKSYAKTKWLFP
jgi:hypothetical protein